MSEGSARSDKLSIVVSFNGLDKKFEVEQNETVQALLERALNDFGITANRHVMALFFAPPDNREITEVRESIAKAGIVAGTRLILRQSTILAG